MIILSGKATLDFSNMGYFVGDRDWIHPEAKLKTHELIFVTKGNVYIEEDGKKYALAPGDLICLKPGKMHRGYRKSDYSEFFWLHFFSEGYDTFGVDLVHTEDMNGDTVFLKKLGHHAMTGAGKELIECELAAFLLSIREKANENAGGNSKLYSDICEYIRINIARHPLLSEISEKFNYNPDYLSRLFRMKSGLSLKKYIDRERCDYACRLLLTTTLSIKEIGAAMGFPSSCAFIKFFEYNTSLSPTAYRDKFYASHTNNK